ncbi:MAG TPA: divalent-cation tolerance protein CutA [Casimicrobiaceae bacterium]|nr:divalent-cation tolerance protein CutA [Casimicrobiaceae bacterium]
MTSSLAAEPILVLTQMPDQDEARALARSLVESRLAACVNVGAPVESLYHWRGQIETATEVPVMIKTQRDRYRELEAAIRARHPYELPEIIAVPVSDGLPAYLQWITAETAGT